MQTLAASLYIIGGLVLAAMLIVAIAIGSAK
jgi:hypothetical protein